MRITLGDDLCQIVSSGDVLMARSISVWSMLVPYLNDLLADCICVAF